MLKNDIYFLHFGGFFWRYSHWGLNPRASDKLVSMWPLIYIPALWIVCFSVYAHVCMHVFVCVCIFTCM